VNAKNVAKNVEPAVEESILNSPKAKINKGSILSMFLKVPKKNNEVPLTVEEQERFDADWERRKNEQVELKRATEAAIQAACRHGAVRLPCYPNVERERSEENH